MQVNGTATRGTDSNSNYFTEVPNVTAFSPFALGEGSPTAVVVDSSAARAVSSGIEIGWETASELYVVGFNLWRAEGSDGAWQKVNKVVVAAEGGLRGNRYTLQDSTAMPGRRYRYRLETLSLLGGSEWSGPVWGQRRWTVYLPWLAR
ncbi:MAG: hypothetical protein HYX94_13095 [Chloroflexi bacterium]|nr:hypothetical protein [Chloroflexota bacterium]